MSTNPLLDRRTRSQITLSDDVLKVPEHSPMKKARNIARLHSEPPDDRRIVYDSEDELLSSSRPPHPSSSKRSVSPPSMNEYGHGALNATTGRHSKRMKWDVGEGGSNSSIIDTNHVRTHSEPSLEPGQEVFYKRVLAISPSSKPNSTSNLPRSQTTPSLTGLTSKTRARSVPLFPAFSSLPSLDLRKLPLSPVRARSPSHSPDKLHGLRVFPSPRKSPTPGPLPQAKIVENEQETSMEVDQDPIPPNPAITENTMVVTASVPGVSVLSPKSPTQPPPPAELSTKPPATPLPGGLGLHFFMSPLTPLPETPHPQALLPEGEHRYNTKEGSILPPERDTQADPLLQQIPRPDFGKPKSTLNTPGLPRAVSRSQIPRLSVGPPSRPVGKPTPIAADAELKTVAPKGSTSSRPDAFALLMKNARGRGEAVQPKTQGEGSMSQKTKALMKPNEAKANAKADSKVKRVPLKNRMRRNEKPKPVVPTKFEPVIFDEDEDQEEIARPEAEEISSTPEESLQASEGIIPHVEPIVPAPPPSHEPPAIPPPSAKQPAVVSAIEVENINVPRSSPSPPVNPSLSNPESVTDALANIQERPATPPVVNEAQVEHGGDSSAAVSAIEVENINDPRSSPSPPVNSSLSNPESVTDALANIQERPATPPVVVNEAQVEHGGDSSVSMPAELEQTQDPLLENHNVGVPEVSMEEQIQPTPQSEPVVITSTKRVAPPVGERPTTRKRARSVVPSSSRVTRSSRSSTKPHQPPPKSTIGRRPRANTTTTNIPREPLTRGTSEKPPSEEQSQPPHSPMQISSPIHPEPRTPSSSPAKISLAKTPSKPIFSMDGSPSPTKIARAVSMFRRTSADDIGVKSSGSSLSTLSNALEKLKMPVPPRPSTSLGFNPDSDKDNDGDDVEMIVSEQPQGPGHQSKNPMHQRSLTVGHAPSVGLSKAQAGPSTGKAGPSTGKPQLVQKPMTNFFAKSGSALTNPRSAKSQLLGSGKLMLGGSSVKGKGKSIFGLGSSSSLSGGLFPMANKRLVQKVSKKSSLPVVVGSPVKGGMAHDITMDDPLPGDDEGLEKAEGVNGASTDVFMATPTKGDREVHATGSSGDTNNISGDKDKEKDSQEKTRKKDSSRRASLAFSKLSQSLSAAPAYGKGSMGPPVTPRAVARSASSTYPMTSTTNDVGEGSKTPSKSSTSPGKALPAASTRFSARQAAKATANADLHSPSISSSPGGSVKTSGEKKKKDGSMSAKKVETLNILNGCIIFVDVKADDGEEAGSLFVEMLESMGARILARVGQTCTHVIFKNGLMSTISRYRLLRDPKPSVVGIAWVVDCVEQRRRVEETPYLIDLKDMNVAGTNKRRRSMLPKLISNSLIEPTPTEVDPDEGGGDTDVSMDGSASSLTLDDDITPLERARRRRSMIFGPT